MLICQMCQVQSITVVLIRLFQTRFMDHHQPVRAKDEILIRELRPLENAYSLHNNINTDTTRVLYHAASLLQNS